MSTEARAGRFNFAPGPAQLPAEVVAEVACAVRAYPPTGRSLLELGHRSDAFAEIAAESEADLRALLDIPDDYAVLFGNGGARLHYALWLPNLAAPDATVGYVDTGHWSRRALAEAQCQRRSVRVLAADAPGDYPDLSDADCADCALVHYVANETLTGLAMPTPAIAPALVCDRTSDFLSAPFDIRRYALVYAGSQKTFGTAGLTALVARRERLQEAEILPAGFRYAAQIAARGLWHTPPVLPWFVASRMLRWIRAGGGLAAMHGRARKRALPLYACIDDGGPYSNAIAARARSLMNVCFRLPDARMQERFLQQAEAAGLAGLRGHAATGGVRASLYNAMPQEGADALLEFMREFARTA